MKKKIISFILISLLALYFALIVSWDYENSIDLSAFFLKFLLCFIMVEILLLIFIAKMDKFNVTYKNNNVKWWEYVVFLIIIATSLAVGMYISYPSIGTWDSIGLWLDFRAGNLSNWHPLIYTLIFHGIPLLISDSPFTTVIFQSVLILILFTYMCIFIRKKYLNFGQTLFFMLIIILNPIFIKFNVCVLKDIPFSFLILVLTIFLIQIVNTDGEWLKSRKNKIFFLLSLLGILTLRHNGIAIFVLVMFVFFISYKQFRKFVLVSFLIIMISFFVITGPIYRKFNVSKSGGKYEMIGLILGNLSYYYNNVYNLTENELQIFHSLTSRENWKKNYDPRDFNKIKYYQYLEPDNIYCGEEVGITCEDAFGVRLHLYFDDSVKLWKDLSIKNPNLFIRAYLNMTSPIWELRFNTNEFNSLYFDDHGSEYNVELNSKAIENFDRYSKLISNTPLKILMFGCGQGLLIIFVSFVFLLRRNGFDLKKILPFLPVLINTIVIMFLITGEEYRLVYSQILCCLPLLLYSLQNDKVKKTIK